MYDFVMVILDWSAGEDSLNTVDLLEFSLDLEGKCSISELRWSWKLILGSIPSISSPTSRLE